MVQVAASGTSANQNGSATWRAVSIRRQRQSVQRARGQTGQVNHTSSLAWLRTSDSTEVLLG